MAREEPAGVRGAPAAPALPSGAGGRADANEPADAGGRCLGHLLLVAVLALGVFAMHTLGHPTGHADASRAPMGTAAHAAATRAHPAPDHGMATMAGPAASPSTPPRTTATPRAPTRPAREWT
ncbi:hypothetical protein O1L44_04295 [Streptomyces noursei]|nr:hypothetical protein [Streptomyces noursei]